MARRLGFIVDGYPRTPAQAQSLDRMLAACGRQLDAVVELQVPAAEVLARIRVRAKTSGRRDDDEQTARQSQMALEDLAMMRAVHGSTVLYPSDATSTACLVREMAERGGVVYMRTTRGACLVLNEPGEAFPVGGAKVVRSSPDDQVTLVCAGVTLHNCLAAADQLGRDGIRARVVDLYS